MMKSYLFEEIIYITVFILKFLLILKLLSLLLRLFLSLLHLLFLLNSIDNVRFDPFEFQKSIFLLLVLILLLFFYTFLFQIHGLAFLFLLVNFIVFLGQVEFLWQEWHHRLKHKHGKGTFFVGFFLLDWKVLVRF